MTGREDAVRIDGWSTPEAGIELKLLEALSVKDRAAYILRKRLEILKENTEKGS